MENTLFQVSTLQALLLGYTKNVINAGQLLAHGDIGLGTFEDVKGEMIVIDGKVYRADADGCIHEVDDHDGIPFSAVAFEKASKEFSIPQAEDIDELKTILNNRIEEDFGLNSMHIIRIDGCFDLIKARSVGGMKSQHIELNEILDKTQRSFQFDSVSGTLVCMYFPDYLDGVNASGWHLHFISDDRKFGGHVFNLKASHSLAAKRIKLSQINIQLPQDAAFDTYALKSVSKSQVEKAEQQKG